MDYSVVSDLDTSLDGANKMRLGTHSINVAEGVKWSIDNFVLRDSSIFIFGWLFVPDQHLKSLSLYLDSIDALTSGSIYLEFGKPRHDVANAFPDNPEALYSGFVGLGTWSRAPLEYDQIRLIAHLQSGNSKVVTIPKEKWCILSQSSKSDRNLQSAHQLAQYFYRGMNLAARGKFKLLGDKLGRHLRQLTQKRISHNSFKSYLMHIGINNESRFHLIVDHQLGGGANQYTQIAAEKIIASGEYVLILTYVVTRLSPEIIIVTKNKRVHFGFDHFADVPTLIQGINVASITYNTAVSFVGAEKIPSLLLELQDLHRSRLRILIHDYFSICPSHFLLEKSGKFCNIPDAAVCDKCLPFNPHGFTSIYSGSIVEWRDLWAKLFRQANEVIAFSQSSAELMHKAFGNDANDKQWLKSIDVRPHSLNHLSLKPIQVSQSDRLVIGVIGHISFHKGSKVVRALAEHIELLGSSERIIVIGTLEERVNSKVVHETGAYKSEDLGQLVKKHGVNVALFPSICPETFSYVTQEIITLGIPLACFNYGAPAERVKAYEKGLVLKSEHPEELLQELQRFFKASYSNLH